MNVVHDKVNDVKIHRNAENCVSERTELRRPLYSGRRDLCTLLLPNGPGSLNWQQ